MRREDGRVGLVAGALAVSALALAFLVVAHAVAGGRTRAVDERILSALRLAEDPARTIGPRWLQSAAMDLTALGSMVVLGLTVAAVVGYLLLQGLHRTATFILAASLGGWMLNWTLKALFERARPDIVPHLREVMTPSFPSGHALTSAAVYLTLGMLLARVAEGRAASVYCVMIAGLVTVCVGASRVLLGVHYPSDVLAGWLAGICWALTCLLIALAIERRAGLRRERREYQEAE